MTFSIRDMALGTFVAFTISAALAATTPAPPSGQAVYNQAKNARSITPSDSAFLTATKGLFVGDATACNVALVLNGDSTALAVTFTNVQSGALLPFSVIQVMSTGTTCATVIGLW